MGSDLRQTVQDQQRYVLLKDDNDGHILCRLPPFVIIQPSSNLIEYICAFRQARRREHIKEFG
jgi:hypothetical protein